MAVLVPPPSRRSADNRHRIGARIGSIDAVGQWVDRDAGAKSIGIGKGHSGQQPVEFPVYHGHTARITVAGVDEMSQFIHRYVTRAEIVERNRGNYLVVLLVDR